MTTDDNRVVLDDLLHRIETACHKSFENLSKENLRSHCDYQLILWSQTTLSCGENSIMFNLKNNSVGTLLKNSTYC